MASSRHYVVATPIPDSVADALQQYDPLTQQFLFERGIVDNEKAERFFNPDYDTHPHDPYLLTDMEKGVNRILDAISKNEHIVIYSDYDCDGIPGGVLLHDFFTDVGFSNFENYIPHRHQEGYGFNVDSVQKFIESNTALIITVDCGITDNEAVQTATDAGIDVIVTDHHEPSDVLPPAYAIINPKRDNAYPFKGICGTTVAYKLATATLSAGRERGLFTLKEGMEKWWLDLVGLATVADMVPLIDENRVYARYGLEVLRKSRRPGLQHLLRKSGTNQRFLSEEDIGFTIAPRINAASRMDDPGDAFHMLRTRDEGEAGGYVAHLEKLNNERKGVVASMTKEARKRVSQFFELPSVIVFGDPEWRPSLVGLVANSLAETYNRPAFLWGRDGKGIIKGSCRSDGVTSIVELMNVGSAAFLSYGGHHASGGFAVDHEKIHTLSDTLLEAFKTLQAETKQNEILQTVSAEIALNDITRTFLGTLSNFAPFGEGNPKPLFAITDVIPKDVQIFGKAKNHTKLKLDSELGNIDAISFFKLPTDFSNTPETLKPVTLLAHVERSFFMGRLETRLRIVDIL